MKRSLRQLQLIERRIPSRISRRSFATIVDTLPTPAPYLPFLPSRSGIHASAFLTPPIATSSKVTLSDPFWSTPGPFPRDPISAALHFATDDDLAAALLLTKEEASWTTSIDPGLAFLALRERPTYPIFLQSVRGCLDRVYTRLKRNGTHDLLVTDLLLKQSDPRLLRDILEKDTASAKADRLRSSLAASVYAHIARPLHNRSIAPLSRKTNLRLAELLISLNQPRHLPTVFDGLYRIAEDDPASIWPLFRIIAHVVPTDVAAATSMFMALLQDDREIIPRKLMGKSNPSHPRWREIMALAAMARCTLRWDMMEESKALVEQLVPFMEESGSMGSGMDAVLEVARVAMSTGDRTYAEWVRSLFKRLASSPKIADLPSIAVDNASETRLDPAWYLSLPSDGYEPPSPSVLMRLAAMRDPAVRTDDVLVRVAHDVLRSGPAVIQPIADALLLMLAKHNLVEQVRAVFHAARPLALSGPTMLAIVQAANRKGDRAFARDVLYDYERQASAGKRELQAADRLLLAEGFIIAKSERHALVHLNALRELDDGSVREAVFNTARRLGSSSAFARLAKRVGLLEPVTK